MRVTKRDFNSRRTALVRPVHLATHAQNVAGLYASRRKNITPLTICDVVRRALLTIHICFTCSAWHFNEVFYIASFAAVGSSCFWINLQRICRMYQNRNCDVNQERIDSPTTVVSETVIHQHSNINTAGCSCPLCAIKCQRVISFTVMCWGERIGTV